MVNGESGRLKTAETGRFSAQIARIPYLKNGLNIVSLLHLVCMRIALHNDFSTLRAGIPAPTQKGHFRRE
jgi:hypothetical protein